MVGEITASGCVVVKDKKILVTNDGKDQFFKIPGGKVIGNELLENCALRELKEEKGFSGKIVSKLSTMKLSKKPGTGEDVNITLHHFKSEIINKLNEFNPSVFNGHNNRWLDAEDIRSLKIKVSPNVVFLLNKEELK